MPESKAVDNRMIVIEQFITSSILVQGLYDYDTVVVGGSLLGGEVAE
jgi:hypothetical protein